MRPRDNIEKVIEYFDIDVNPAKDREILDELQRVQAKSRQPNSGIATSGMWRITMKSKMIKLATVAVVIIAVLIGMNQFGGSVGGDSVAFGEVLEYLRTSSYTFDLTIDADGEKQGSTAFTMQAMVWESGRMRVDCSIVGVGKISSITDLNAGRTLLLFHREKTGVIKKESVLNRNTGAEGIVSFCAKPIEKLWNLLDGAEEHLGEKQIDGQYVTGFRVLQEGRYFEYDITIWADSESGIVSLVEVTANPLDRSYPSMTWVMKNFALDVELDEELFSLDLPTGYILAYQEDLENLEVETEASVESEKIVQMLELGSGGRKDEAIEILLRVDWTKQIEFGKEPYIFSVSETAYKSLKAEDQKRASKEIFGAMATVKGIALEVLDLGRIAVSVKQYEEAAGYFNAGLQLGKLLDRDPDSMVIVRLCGLSIENKALNEMISLYTTTANQKGLQEAEEQLCAVKAEVDEFKKKARGQ